MQVARDLGEWRVKRPGNRGDQLIFNLIAEADGYENPQWLTKTTANDRGRDLSVNRVRADALTGVLRERVIIQAKHWLKTSVGLDEVTSVVAQMELWTPPPVDVLVIATSGRFTTDAIDWIERHNNNLERPRVEMWPSSHLELLVASRPHVAASVGLTRT